MTKLKEKQTPSATMTFGKLHSDLQLSQQMPSNALDALFTLVAPVARVALIAPASPCGPGDPCGPGGPGSPVALVKQLLSSRF